MDPAPLIPTPDAIPVAWGWFQLLLLPTFFLHILLMNAMAGSVFIALISHCRRDGGVTPCTIEISRNLPFTIAFAVNFGIAPYLFVQTLYGHFMYVSSILMAVFWLSIITLLIGAYSLAYVYKYHYERLQGGRVLVTGLITCLLLLIAFFFVNNLTLMQSPAAWSRFFDHPGGLLLNLKDPTLFPRYLHFMVSAVAVGGLAVALFFAYRLKKGDKSAEPWVAYGCRWFSSATLLNLGLGIAFLAALPKEILTSLAPLNLLFLACLAGGIGLAVPAVIHGFSARLRPALLCALGTLALMILARSLLRSLMLAPWFSLAHLPLSPSRSPFVVFLLFLAASVALIVWMVRFTMRHSTRKEAQP
jgi:hypothetical protein